MSGNLTQLQKLLYRQLINVGNMESSKLVPIMRKHFSEDTIADFLLFNKRFNEPRFKAMKEKAIDMVSTILLAAAKNKELFYDVVELGKESGIASKPTFSRRKNFLKELGIIEEEKLKMDFGRPRIRLILNEEKFREHFNL